MDDSQKMSAWAAGGALVAGVGVPYAISAAMSCEVTLAALVGVPCLAASYAAVAGVAGWPLPGAPSSKRRRKTEAKALASELRARNASWRRVADARTDIPISEDMDPEMITRTRRANWDASNAHSLRVHAEQKHEWEQQYRGRVLSLYEQLLRDRKRPYVDAYGETHDGDQFSPARFLMTSPTNPLGMDHVADVLDALAGGESSGPA